MKNKKGSLYFLLCCALFASGCGSRTVSNQNAGGVEEEKITTRASELVTMADAEKVLKVPVKLGSDTSISRESLCYYQGQNFAQGEPSSLSVRLYLSSTEDRAKAYFEDISTPIPSVGKVQPLTGLGDQSGLLIASPATLAILVRKNRTIFILKAMGNASQRPSLVEMRSLTQRIVDEL